MDATIWYMTMILSFGGTEMNNITQEYPSKEDCNRAISFYQEYYKKTDLNIEAISCINSNFYSRPLSNGTFIKTIRNN